MKKIAFIMLAVVLLLSVTACKADKEVVIGKVGDTELYLSDFENTYNATLSNYYYMYDMTNEENIKALQDIVFDILIRGEVIYQQALSQGYDLTEEEEKQLDLDVQQQYDLIYANYMNTAQNEGATNVDARAKELFKVALKENGYTEDSLLKKVQKDMRKAAVSEKLEDAVWAEVTLTEQEALERFSADLDADRATFTNSPSVFADAQGAYEANSSRPPLYVPDGYVRVKHILVADEAVAITLVERINAGEDFDKLMEEFGTDPGMKAEPNKSLGYLMNKDTGFVPEFKEAALALINVGDITKPVKTDHGYHIIKLVDRLKSGERTFDEVKVAYMASLLDTMKTEHFGAKVTEWISTAQITRNDELIRDVGKAAKE